MISNLKNNVSALPNPLLKVKNDDDKIAKFNKLVQTSTCGQPLFTFTSYGKKESLEWSCYLNFMGISTYKTSSSKTSAKKLAIIAWMDKYEALNNVACALTNVRSNMENADEEGQTLISVDKTSNTIVASAHGSSHTNASRVVDNNLNYISGGIHTFPYLHNRYLAVAPFEWTPNQNPGTVIKSYVLPYDFLKENKTSPAAALFNQFLLVRPHLSVKVTTNATKFHSGTLVVGFRYNSAAQDGVTIDSGRQVQQMNCTYVQASSSNDACLAINYMHPFDFINTSNTVAAEALYFGELYIAVVNKLGVGDGGSPNITVTPLLSFNTDENDTQFAILQSYKQFLTETSMRGNMMAAIGAIGAVGSGVGSLTKGVESMYKGVTHFFSSEETENEDRPILPVDRTTFSTQPIYDMSLGNGPVDMISMRLSKDVRVPYSNAKLPIASKQFNIRYLTSVFAGFDNFSWSTTQNPFEVLIQLPVTPLLFDSKSFASTNRVLYTPLAEISSHFKYYMGSIVFRLIFGSSQMHSGRIALVFTPKRNVTLDATNWTDYPYAVFDLQEQVMVTYTAPQAQYTSVVPICWDYKIVEGASVSYAYVYGYVNVIIINRLRQIDSIASTISCECQAAGSDDFKLLVPNQSFISSLATPSITLRGNMEEARLAKPTDLIPMPSSNPTNNVIGEEFDLAALCRRMAVIGGISEVLPAQSVLCRFNVNAGYPIARVDAQKLDIVTAMHDGYRFFKGSINYIIQISSDKPLIANVSHIPGDECKYNQLRPILWTVDDNYTALNVASQTMTPSYNTCLPISVPYYAPVNMLVNGDTSFASSGSYAPYYANNGSIQINFNCSVDNTAVDLTIYRALGDDAEMFCFQGFPLRSNDGLPKMLSAFGPKTERPKPEIFPVERPNRCVFGQRKPPPADVPVNNIVLYMHFYDASIGLWRSPVQFTNDGPDFIGILRNGGSVIVSGSKERPNVTVGANYLYYDRSVPGSDLKIAWGTNSTIVLKGGGNWLVPDISITSIVQPYTILATVDMELPSDEVDDLVGNIESSCQPPKLAPHDIIKILRKNVPDFRCKKSYMDETYAERRVKVHLRRLVSEEKQLIYQQGKELQGNMDRLREIRQTISTSIRNTVNMPSNVSNAANTVSEVGDRLNVILDQVTNFSQSPGLTQVNDISWFSLILNTISESVTAGVNSVFCSLKTLILNCLTHVFNIFVSDDYRIKISSLLGILISLNVVYADKLVDCFNMLRNFLVNKICGNAPPNREEDDPDVKEGLSWFNFLLPACTAALGFKATYNKIGMKAFHSYFSDTIRLSNDLSLFCTRNFDFVRKYAYWVVGKENPHMQNVGIIKEKQEEMREWAKEVLRLTQGHVRDRIFASSGLQKHVDLLFRQGSTYVDVIRERNLVSTAFNQVYEKISRLHFDLGQRVGRGNLIKEPVVVWMYGKSGVGKSNIAKDFAGKFLVEEGVHYDGDYCYVRNFTRFWNNWADQPALIIDDAFQNRSPENLCREVSEVFSICSIAEFNPEMPAIEDKNRLVNPDIVVMCSNVTHPVINCVQDQNALWRRRDVLVEVALTQDLLDMGVVNANDSRISDEMLSDFSHLRFRVLDPMNNQSQPTDEWSTYEEFIGVTLPQLSTLRRRRNVAARRRQIQGLLLSDAAYAQRAARLDLGEQVESVRRHSPNLLEDLTSALNRFERGGIDEEPCVDEESVYTEVDSDESEEDLRGNCGACYDDSGAPERVCFVPIPENPNFTCACDLFMYYGSFCFERKEYVLHIPDLINARDSLEFPTQMIENIFRNDSWFMLKSPFPNDCYDVRMRYNDRCGEGCLTQDLAARLLTFVRHTEVRSSFSPEQNAQLLFLSRQVVTTQSSPGFMDRYALQQQESATYMYTQFDLQTRFNSGEFQQTMPAAPLHWSPVPTPPLSSLSESLASSSSSASLRSSVEDLSGLFMDMAPGMSPVIGASAFDEDPRVRDAFVARLQAIADAEASELGRRPPVSSTIWSYLKQTALVLLMFCSALVILYTVYKMFAGLKDLWQGKNYFSWAFDRLKLNLICMLSLNVFTKCYTSLMGNIQSSGDTNTARIAPTNLILNTTVIRGDVEGEEIGIVVNDPMQVAGPNENTNELNKRILKNTLSLQLYTEELCLVKNVDEGVPQQLSKQILVTTNFFMVGGRKGISPFHFANALADRIKSNPTAKARVIVRTDENKEIAIPVSVEDLVFHRFGKLDLAWVEFPSRVPCFRKVTGQVAGLAEHKRFKCNARVVNGYDVAMKIPTFTRLPCKRVQAKTSYSGLDEIYLLGYQYDWAGQGRCSAVLVDDDRDMIVGLHVSGTLDDKTGYSVVLDKEMLENILSATDKEPPVVSPGVLVGSTPVMQPNGQAVMIGKVAPRFELRPVVKTKIRPSVMSGCVSYPSRYPVNMKKSGEKRPGYTALRVGVEKQLNPAHPFPQHIVAEAVEFLQQKVLAVAHPITAGATSCRSISEAVLGVNGVDFMDPLKLGTSAGWPLCTNGGRTTKAHYVDIDRDKGEVVLRPELESIYFEQHNQRLDCVTPFVVYADFGKDERLKPGKDMRLINGSPFAQTIEWRRYCMDAFAAIQSAQLELGSAIGINPYGFGFEKVAIKLLEKGDKIITGDYTAFGPTIQPEFITGISSIINAWNKKYTYNYNYLTERVVVSLFEEVTNCIHIAGDLLYMTVTGCPSGNPFTAIINTLSNLLYLYCSWLIIFKGTRLATLAAFDKHVYAVCYGDDFVGATNTVVAQMWNANTISKCFGRYGIKFTDASKKEEVTPFTKIHEAEFLKNTFRLHPIRNIFVACLRKEVIEDIVNWIREPCPDEILQLQEVSLQVARFASLHGNDYFLHVVVPIREWFANNKIHCAIPPWSYFDNLFDSNTELEWSDEELF